MCSAYRRPAERRSGDRLRLMHCVNEAGTNDFIGRQVGFGRVEDGEGRYRQPDPHVRRADGCAKG